MKPTRISVALFLSHPQDPTKFLIVKRPETDDKLPNVWGLPADYMQDGEDPEETAKRVGVDKLSTDVIPESIIGVKMADRGEYVLILMDIKAQLSGKEPDVSKATTNGTKYIDQRWTSDISSLIDAASKGSLCSQVILDDNGIEY